MIVVIYNTCAKNKNCTCITVRTIPQTTKNLHTMKFIWNRKQVNKLEKRFINQLIYLFINLLEEIIIYKYEN